MNASLSINQRPMPARMTTPESDVDNLSPAVLIRSNVVPQDANAKRMLFYRWLVDAGKVTDDDK